MRISLATLFLAVTAAALSMSAARPQERPASKDQTDESIKKVKALQKERIAILKEAADVSLKLAKNSRLGIGEAMEDRMALLKAELENAEKESERVALSQQALDALKEYQEVAQVLVDNCRETHLPLLKVKARRLELEIQIEQAKAKGAK